MVKKYTTEKKINGKNDISVIQGYVVRLVF